MRIDLSDNMDILKVLAIVVIVSACNVNGHGLDPEVCANIQGYYDYASGCTLPVQMLLVKYLHGPSSPDESPESSDGDQESSATTSSSDIFEADDVTFSRETADVDADDHDDDDHDDDDHDDDDDEWDLSRFEQAACGWGMEQLEICMSELHDCQDEEIDAQLDTIIENYQNTFCNGDQLHERFQKFAGTASNESLIALYSGLSCSSPEELQNLLFGDECIFDADEYDLDDRSFEDALGILEGGFRGTFACIREHLADCGDLSRLEPVLFYFFSLQMVPGFQVTFDEVAEGFDSSAAKPNEERRSTVTVYGDPHMTIFGGGTESFVTCSAEGEQNYLTNAYVQIRGTNTQAFPGSDYGATYMTAVHITILDGRGQAMAVYAAGDSDLPSDFSSIEPESDATVTAVSSTYVLIGSQTGGLAIALNLYAHTYQMAVRMSDSVLSGSSGLLYSGCPPGDIININAVIVPSKKKRRRRSTVCDEVAAGQREACEFDYMVTDNATLAVGATSSVAFMVEDAEELDETLVTVTDGVATTRPGPYTLLAAVICLLMLRG